MQREAARVIGAKALLQRLGTNGISEITMVTGQSPYGNEGALPTVLDTVVLTTDDILQILFAAGGSRHVDTLGAKASNWTARIDGVGLIAVTATMHGELVQARFTLRATREMTPPLGLTAQARSTPITALPPQPPRPKPAAALPPQPPARPAPAAALPPQPPPRPAPIDTVQPPVVPMPVIPGRPVTPGSTAITSSWLRASERPTPPSRPAPIIAPSPSASALDGDD